MRRKLLVVLVLVLLHVAFLAYRAERVRHGDWPTAPPPATTPHGVSGGLDSTATLVAAVGTWPAALDA